MFYKSTSLSCYSYGKVVEVEGGEEEYSFCYINLWFKMLFGVCELSFAFVTLDCFQLPGW